MLRYIVILWNVNNVSDCNTVSDLRRRIRSCSVDWRVSLDEPGVCVACADLEFSSSAAITVHECRGVILGKLFKSPDSCYSDPPIPIRYLSQPQSAEILRSKGQSLISHYWGDYVAVLHYPETASTMILRGPVSQLACFHAGKNSFNALLSHVDDFIDLKITPLSINWDSITAQVVGGDYLTSETAIDEIDSLECGGAVEFGPTGGVERVLWDPRSLLEERSPATFYEAAATIRRATEYCVRAHAASHDGILVNLSGGLDSSIVLSALNKAPHRPSITAVNYYCGGSGDERRFARSMADAVNCRLIERARNQKLDLRMVTDCNRTGRPVLNFSAPDVESRNLDLARELGATAVFDGELGDNIFGSYPSIGVVVESFRQGAFGTGFLGAALDYAMLTRQSLWRTVALARREARSVVTEPNFYASREIRRAYGSERARSAILSSEEAEARHARIEERFLHPWFKQSRRIAPGSHALLFGLIAVTSTSYHSPFSGWRDPPRVSPFVSQPLIEISLRMPRHLHCKFGQDRAVARAAFADALPPDVLHRGLGKGGPGLWLRDIIESNNRFLREFLLDGILAKRGLLDRRKLEAVLSPRISKSTVVAGDIFAKLYIEAWLRKWQPAVTVSAGRREGVG